LCFSFFRVVIRIPDLLRRATDNQGNPALVYIFDKSDSKGSPLFLGGVEITPAAAKEKGADLVFVAEQELEDVRGASKLYQEMDVQIANKVWTISVLSLAGTYEPDYVFVVVGGVIILLASVGLAWWVHQNTNRVAKINRLKAEADAERASLILESARKAADAERELNDFIAHEVNMKSKLASFFCELRWAHKLRLMLQQVRNPVSAALSAVSFVSSELKRKNPLQDEESLTQTREDVYIIDNALKFVNDLLRNMLDMHRAANKQLKVTLSPTDLLHDVLEPVQAMLTQRGGKIRVEVKCEDGLFAQADRLRLKQVMLNLGRNSAKFVEEGFIRLTATPYGDEHIQIAVEDSGPGIPEEKKKLLFQKYQESLDMLSQGTVSFILKFGFEIARMDLVGNSIILALFSFERVLVFSCARIWLI
jgi:signal transduction histidine kinase